MRVLSISGKKRSTKRKSSKLRRRKGRYSGGMEQGQEEFKDDDEDVPVNFGMTEEQKQLGQQQKEELIRMKEAMRQAETPLNVQGSEQPKSFKEYDEQIQNLLDTPEEYNPINRETIKSFFKENLDEPITVLNASDVSTRINNNLSRIFTTLKITDPKITSNASFTLNSSVKLINAILKKVIEEDDNDAEFDRSLYLHNKITFLLYYLMLCMYNFFKRVNINISVVKPDNIRFGDLKSTNGLTSEEIIIMKKNLSTIQSTMDPEKNNIDKQGKDLETIYIEILQPLYTKLTSDSPIVIEESNSGESNSSDSEKPNKPKLEITKPDGLNRGSIPSSSSFGTGTIGTSMNGKPSENTSGNHSLLRVPPPPSEPKPKAGEDMKDGFYIRPSQGDESPGSSTSTSPGPTPPVTPKSMLSGVEKAFGRFTGRTSKPTGKNALNKKPSQIAGLTGGKSRKRRKSRSRRSTRKKSRKSSRRTKI